MTKLGVNRRAQIATWVTEHRNQPELTEHADHVILT